MDRSTLSRAVALLLAVCSLSPAGRCPGPPGWGGRAGGQGSWPGGSHSPKQTLWGDHPPLPPGMAGAMPSSPQSLGQREVRSVPDPRSLTSGRPASPQEAQRIWGGCVQPPGVSCPLWALRLPSEDRVGRRARGLGCAEFLWRDLGESPGPPGPAGMVADSPAAGKSVSATPVLS